MGLDLNTQETSTSTNSQTEGSIVTNYRKYSDEYIDSGREVSVIVPATAAFTPNFYSRDTIQLWDVTNIEDKDVGIWVGNTLVDRSLHEITISNNGNLDTVLTFGSLYLLVDEEEGLQLNEQITTIPANTTAHYYCTAVLEKGSLFLHLRVGSQDTRPRTLPSI